MFMAILSYLEGSSNNYFEVQYFQICRNKKHSYSVTPPLVVIEL